MKILITGGAGFVGSSIARSIVESKSNSQVVVFDNMRRRGSELNLPTFKRLGIEFVHGDIRHRSDLDDLQGEFDFLIEASAEPSVSAGTDGYGLQYLMDTNLSGTINCLEFARKRTKGLIFLSTSRVYSIPSLLGLKYRETPSRLIPENNDIQGFSSKGVNELFSVTNGFRSFYGSSKLSSELFVQEYARAFNLPSIINRCGVIAGPGQFGKTDQGVFTLWVARHFFSGSLKYTGFGGKGKQVRDLLHPDDLNSLIRIQLEQLSKFKGEVFCVGGGTKGSVSLMEYTKICQEITGNTIPISEEIETTAVDLPWFVTDSTKVMNKFDWRPTKTPIDIASDITTWFQENTDTLKPLFT